MSIKQVLKTNKWKLLVVALILLLLCGIKKVVFSEPRFYPNCGWQDEINGDCDTKGNVKLTKKELNEIMRRNKVTKDELLEEAERVILERRKQLEYKAKNGLPPVESYVEQINRLEEIKRILLEDN